MHFIYFERALKKDIMRWSQSDSRFTNYSISTMRLCGLRSFAAPLLSAPVLGSFAPAGSGFTPGAGGGGSTGVMGLPSPGVWGSNAPMGFGRLRGFRGGSPFT
jgi:hypothetical protein